MKVELGEKLTYDLEIFAHRHVNDEGKEEFKKLIERLINQGYHRGLFEQWENEESHEARLDGNSPS